MKSVQWYASPSLVDGYCEAKERVQSGLERLLSRARKRLMLPKTQMEASCANVRFIIVYRLVREVFWELGERGSSIYDDDGVHTRSDHRRGRCCGLKLTYLYGM